MFQLKDLFQKFRDIEDPNENKRKIASILNNIIKTDLITPENIDYKNNVVWLKINPAIKHKILTSKPLCIELLNKTITNHTIIDIR